MTKVTPFEYAQFAYLVYEEPNNSKKLERTLIPKEWQVLTFYKHKDISTITGYFGMAFKKNNHIVIAHRGTSTVKSLTEDYIEVEEVLDTLNDYISDLQLWLNKKPLQFNAAQAYTNQIIKNFPDCTFSFTGHSLGAVLAQLLAAYYKKEAVVFDSPGVKPIIDNIIKSSPKEIVIFNSYPNVINTINTHYTQPWLLKNILICPQKPSIKEFLSLTTQFHSMSNIMQQFNTSNSFNTYTTKLDSWPQNIHQAYRFFISYDQNKALWDYCLLQIWQQNSNLKQQYTTFNEFRKYYIQEQLYSKNSDPLVVAKNFLKELKAIEQDQFNPKNSLIFKLIFEENTEVFSKKSIVKSLFNFVTDKLLDLGNKLIHRHISAIYDRHTEIDKEKLPGSEQADDYSDF